MKKIYFTLSLLCCTFSMATNDDIIENTSIENRTTISGESEKDDTIYICMSTDNNYAQHAGVTIASILSNANTNDKLHIFVLHNGLTNENVQKLHSLQKIKPFTLVLRKVSAASLKGLVVKHDILSIATWFRLFINQLCPECTNKILYLDVDMVIRKSLKDLWNTDLTSLYAAVVDDFQTTGYMPLSQESRKMLPLKKDILKLSPPYRYFNAGMILFNIKKCLSDDIFNKAIKYAQDHSSQLMFEDQDTLNHIMRDNVRFIPTKYNYQCANEQMFYKPKKYYLVKHDLNSVIEAYKDPVIIHYIGAGKPWKFFSTHKLRGEYLKYLAMTPWNDNISTLSNIRYQITTSIRRLFHTIKNYILGNKLPF